MIRRSRFFSGAYLLLAAAVFGCAGGSARHNEAVPIAPATSSVLAPSSAVPPSSTRPFASASAPSASASASMGRVEPSLPSYHQVNAGFAVDPREPSKVRSEIVAEAALVWEMVPAPENSSGPKERDATITRLVVNKNGRAEVALERREAVFSSATSLWHLAPRELPVTVTDCSVGKRIRRKDQQIVFESLEGKKRVIAPMEGHIKNDEWARLDLEAMVGPWVSITIDRVANQCEGRPLGSPYRTVVDLDRGETRTFALPTGALERNRSLVQSVVERGCGSGGETIEPEGASFYYDRDGNLVAEHGFLAYTAPVCFGGVTRVFVGTYELPPEVLGYARLPAWLRDFVREHPTRSVSTIPIGREAAARKAFESLPLTPPKLPRDSNP